MAKASFRDILNSNSLVFVDFFATWCGPCKAMDPVLKQLKTEFADQLKVVKIDVDKNQELADKYGVQGVRNLQLYKNGKRAWQQAGALPLNQLRSVIQQQINL